MLTKSYSLAKAFECQLDMITEDIYTVVFFGKAWGKYGSL